VLIVGGGPVGLTTALLLRRQGVGTVLVERHPGTAIHPRARGINVRSMEIFRALGLEEAIRAAGAPLMKNRYMLWVQTLAGEEVRRAPLRGYQSEDRVASISPTTWAGCAQDDLEPILVDACRKRGAGLHFGTELISFAQDSSGVSARLRDRETGVEQTIKTRYLVAADGASSPVRAALGVASRGPGTLSHAISVYFRADLRDLVEDRWFVLCFVEDPAVRGLLLSVNNTDRWIFQVPYEPAEEPASAYTPERCADLVRKAIGQPDLPVEILSIIPWEPAAFVADTLRVGRVLLAGDAAHVVPPAGAFGMNVGIQDAHNLAWKLAAVVNGAASPRLLDSYEPERRPIAELMVEHTVENESRRFAHATPGRTILRSGHRPFGGGSVQAPERPPEPVDDLAMMLGYWYASSAVVDGPTEAPTLDAIAGMGLVLDGRPGTRVPHLWLEGEGAHVSTLDLVEGRFVLLAGPSGGAWLDAVTAAATSRRAGVRALQVGADVRPDDGEAAWCAANGVDRDGAVVIRPDGFVGWRSGPGDRPSSGLLGRVLDRLLGRA
jgi:putative polyketide hydroxylase